MDVDQQSGASSTLRVVEASAKYALSEAEFELLTSVTVRRAVEVGAQLISKGEFGRSMYLIETGEVCLEFGDEQPDKVLGPGEYFGELVLFIGSHQRMASATAMSAAVVHVLDKGMFKRLLHQHPLPIAEFMSRSFSRLVASEQQLIARLRRRNEDLLQAIDQLRRTEDRLQLAERQVRSDDLTGLCNRRGLYKYLENLCHNIPPDSQLALLLIDVDDFKRVNDLHGHLTGDRVLRAVAQALESAAGARDLPIRLGGDEFALLAEVHDRSDLLSLAERVQHTLRQYAISHQGQSISCSVSMGGVLCVAQSDWPQWYSDADAALYRAKAQGGNAYDLG